MARKLDLEKIKFYRVGDQFYHSVTTFLKAKAKGEGYERWLGNHPSYKSACEERDRKRDVGLWVHERIPKVLASGGDIVRYRGQNAGYLASFLRFCGFYAPGPILLEEPVINKKKGYGGTPDFFGWISVKRVRGSGRERALALLDWKTSKRINPDQFLQPASYLIPMKRSTWWRDVMRPGIARTHPRIFTGIVRLSPDGSFNPLSDIKLHNLREVERDYAAAMGIKKAFDWEHREEVVSRHDLLAASYPVPHPKIVYG